MLRTLACAAFAALLALPLSADTASPGWSLASAPNPAFLASTARLPNGDFVTWDGQSVDRWTSSGAFVANLETFPNFTFGSFCTARPSGDAVLIGESSQNNVYLVPTNGSGAVLVGNVFLNYDARFEDNDHAILSAGTFGAPTNDLVRLDVTNGSQELIATVPGPSGPLALAPNGDLYYATQVGTFPPPVDSTDVIFWTAAEIQGAAMLDQSDATLFGSDYDGGASMQFDPVSGALLLAETNFGTGVNRILQVAPSAANALVVAVSNGSIGDVEVFALGGPGSLQRFQPAGGVRLTYTTTDFGSFADIVVVDPKRPTLTVSGPGATSFGSVTLAIDGALPNGSAQLLYSPQSLLSPTENTFPFVGFLWHTLFVPGQVRRIPFLVPVNASGHGQITFFNPTGPGNFTGDFGWQYWVGTASGNFLGSTPVEVF